MLDEVLDAAADAVEDWARTARCARANKLERVGLASGATRGAAPQPTDQRPAGCDGHRAPRHRLAKVAAPWLTPTSAAFAGGRRASGGIAEQVAAEHARADGAHGEADTTRSGAPARPLGTDPGCWHTRANCEALAERYRTVRDGRVGQALRHVTYAAMPHGAKSFLAAALALASWRAAGLGGARREIADRVAEELAAWLGDPGARGHARAAHLAGVRALRAGPRRERGARRDTGGVARRAGRASSSPACRHSSSTPSRRTSCPRSR